MDVHSIAMGVNFANELAERVAGCKVFLAVIGTYWLEAMDDRLRTRSGLEDDFLRLEVESALQHRVLVIPVLVHGATMPPVERLPTTLRDLAFLNCAHVRPDPDFHADMERLIQSIASHLPSHGFERRAPARSTEGASSIAGLSSAGKLAIAGMGVAVLAGAFVTLGLLLSSKGGTGTNWILGPLPEPPAPLATGGSSGRGGASGQLPRNTPAPPPADDLQGKEQEAGGQHPPAQIIEPVQPLPPPDPKPDPVKPPPPPNPCTECVRAAQADRFELAARKFKQAGGSCKACRAEVRERAPAAAVQRARAGDCRSARQLERLGPGFNLPSSLFRGIIPHCGR